MKKMKAKLIILGFGIVVLTVLVDKNVFGYDEIFVYTYASNK